MNFYKLWTISLLILSSNLSFSMMSEPETARIKSTGGAGVGSILINESPLLNPASIVFFNNSTFLYQKTQQDLNDKNKNRTSDYKNGKKELLIISDTTSGIKGGFAYHHQNEDSGKRRMFALSLANNIGKRSAFGMAIRHLEEESTITNKTYNQFVLGGTHVYSNELSLGFNIVDATQIQTEYFHYRGGFHYTYKNLVTLIGDIGSGDVENYEKESFSMFALQFQLMESIFLRTGRFHDKRLNQKGNAVGFSWTGPKLSLEYAVKSSELIEKNSDTLMEGEKIVEMTVGMTLLI